MLARKEKERKFATAFKKNWKQTILEVHWLIENDSAYWAMQIARNEIK